MPLLINNQPISISLLGNLKVTDKAIAKLSPVPIKINDPLGFTNSVHVVTGEACYYDVQQDADNEPFHFIINNAVFNITLYAYNNAGEHLVFTSPFHLKHEQLANLLAYFKRSTTINVSITQGLTNDTDMINKDSDNTLKSLIELVNNDPRYTINIKHIDVGKKCTLQNNEITALCTQFFYNKFIYMQTRYVNPSELTPCEINFNSPEKNYSKKYNGDISHIKNIIPLMLTPETHIRLPFSRFPCNSANNITEFMQLIPKLIFNKQAHKIFLEGIPRMQLPRLETFAINTKDLTYLPLPRAYFAIPNHGNRLAKYYDGLHNNTPHITVFNAHHKNPVLHTFSPAFLKCLTELNAIREQLNKAIFSVIIDPLVAPEIDDDAHGILSEHFQLTKFNAQKALIRAKLNSISPKIDFDATTTHDLMTVLIDFNYSPNNFKARTTTATAGLYAIDVKKMMIDDSSSDEEILYEVEPVARCESP